MISQKQKAVVALLLTLGGAAIALFTKYHGAKRKFRNQQARIAETTIAHGCFLDNQPLTEPAIRPRTK